MVDDGTYRGGILDCELLLIFTHFDLLSVPEFQQPPMDMKSYLEGIYVDIHSGQQDQGWPT